MPVLSDARSQKSREIGNGHVKIGGGDTLVFA